MSLDAKGAYVYLMGPKRSVASSGYTLFKPQGSHTHPVSRAACGSGTETVHAGASQGKLPLRGAFGPFVLRREELHSAYSSLCYLITVCVLYGTVYVWEGFC